MLELQSLSHSASDHDTKHPDWWHELQRRYQERLIWPSAKMERWKYTDLSGLRALNQDANYQNKMELPAHLYEDECIALAFINQEFRIISKPKALDAIIILPLEQALETHEDLLKSYLLKDLWGEEDFFATLNMASNAHGLFIYVPKGLKVNVPMHLLAQAAQYTQMQFYIIMEEGSKLNIIEEYFDQLEQTETGFVNILHRIFLKKDASLTYHKWQHNDYLKIHSATMMVEQSEASHFSHCTVTTGSQFSRDELTVNLLGSLACAETYGLSKMTRKNQYIDHHVNIQHHAKNTQSNMLYKNTLHEDGKTIFNGRLYVDQDVDKINAYQGNHNLVLHQKAEVYSKPELEIYAEDVKCKHGATIGELDKNALFYLRSRGLPKEKATALLIESFAGEILATIPYSRLKKRILEVFA